MHGHGRPAPSAVVTPAQDDFDQRHAILSNALPGHAAPRLPSEVTLPTLLLRMP